MSETTSHNPDNNPLHNSSMHNNNNYYELISAYIDNQVSEEEKHKIKLLIESNKDYNNRYVFETLVKDTLKKHNKRIDTPVYIYKNIGQGIDNYIKNAPVTTLNNYQYTSNTTYANKLQANRKNLRKYLVYSSFAFIILIALAFLLNNFLKNNPVINDHDFVAVSRKVFDKIEAGDVKIQHHSSNAKELADTMNKYLDFKIFVPDVKDATLVGGVCNEINGEKVGHIVHKKGNVIIYTFQANKNEVLANDENKIILSKNHKQSLEEGKNWFPCLRDKRKTAVIWFRDNVICATIAELEPHEISSVLTNYK